MYYLFIQKTDELCEYPFDAKDELIDFVKQLLPKNEIKDLYNGKIIENQTEKIYLIEKN